MAFLSRINISKYITAVIAAVFCLTSIVPPSAYGQNLSFLPLPGTMISLTQAMTPVLLKGVKVSPENPFDLTLILDTGDRALSDEALREESSKLAKYFLAALTVPENDLWVNLSPYEADRIIPEQLGLTEMGRDMLAQDYLLKQLTASLLYPESGLGQEFWSRVKQKMYERYGTTDIPVNAFHKVWIVPETAEVYEHGDVAFVTSAKMNVMLEQDYLAMKNSNERLANQSGDNPQAQGLATQMIRDVVMPELKKEINEGAHFAPLRQMYYALILSVWFKRNNDQNILGNIFFDQNKIAGVNVKDTRIKEKIYSQYVKSFQTGVFDYIKEEYDPVIQAVTPQKYVSGGAGFERLSSAYKEHRVIDRAEGSIVGSLREVQLRLNPQYVPVTKEKDFESIVLEKLPGVRLSITEGEMEIKKTLDEWFASPSERAIARPLWRIKDQTQLIALRNDQDGTLVGLASYRVGASPFIDDLADNIYYVDAIEVDQAHRGEEYAKYMLAVIMQKSLQDQTINEFSRGIIALHPMTAEQGERPVKNYYYRLGFEDVEESVIGTDLDERDRNLLLYSNGVNSRKIVGQFSLPTTKQTTSQTNRDDRSAVPGGEVPITITDPKLIKFMEDFDDKMFLRLHQGQPLPDNFGKIMSGDSRAAVSIDGFPNLIFKTQNFSEFSEGIPLDEASRMAEVAKKLGYSVVVIDGIPLVKIKGFAAVVFYKNMVIQQRVELIDDPIYFTALKSFLESKGIYGVPDKLANMGLVEERQGDQFVKVPVVIDTEDVQLKDRSETKGGIDFNPAYLNMREGGAAAPAFHGAEWLNEPIYGFAPIILHITPVTNLPFLLGAQDAAPDLKLSAYR